MNNKKPSEGGNVGDENLYFTWPKQEMQSAQLQPTSCWLGNTPSSIPKKEKVYILVIPSIRFRSIFRSSARFAESWNDLET
jgi:hypothetical protein